MPEDPSKVQQVKVHLTERCLNLIEELQAEFECGSKSELIEYLVLSQRHSAKEAKRFVAERPKRGRRWPAKPEGSEE